MSDMIEPGCYASGCVTISKPPGIHAWSATSSKGYSWSYGEMDIFEGKCNSAYLFIE